MNKFLEAIGNFEINREITVEVSILCGFVSIDRGITVGIIDVVKCICSCLIHEFDPIMFVASLC